MALDAPGSLWLLLIVPAFLLASLVSIRRVEAWHRTFGGRQKRRSRYYVGTCLLCLVLFAVSMATARPKVQYERTVFNRSGIDLLIGIDVSKSMLAEDTPLPAEARGLFRTANRLNRARQFALEILSRLQGERVGVFLFASRGVEVVPFTRDYGFCRYILTYINDGEITVPGSDLGQAIRKAVSLFEEESGEAARILVLISDGEDTRPDPSFSSESALFAAGKGIRIFTVGIGTGRSVPIPVRSGDGSRVVSYYLDEEGNPLKTRLEPGPLKAVAGTAGGRYFSVAESAVAGELLKAVLQEAGKMEYTRTTEKTWMRLSPFLLLAGLLLFVCGVCVER